MSTAPSWDSTRWRGSGTPGQPHHGEASNLVAQPPMSAPTAIHPNQQRTFLDAFPKDNRPLRPATDRPPSEKRPPSEPYSGPAYERQSSASSGNYGPQQLAATSPRQRTTTAGAWQSSYQDHVDHRQHHGAAGTRLTEPLALYIPTTPETAPSTQVLRSETNGRPSHEQRNVPSLPSFATLQEHTSRLSEPDADGPEIAPMNSRISCYLCTKLKPMVREAAIAVAELDENVQSYCNQAVTRSLDIPTDSPVRTVQWIIDRLRNAKRDMQDFTARRCQPAYFWPQPPQLPSASRAASPPGDGVKRVGSWDDPRALKRPRSGDSPEAAGLRMFATAYHPDRRASLDFVPHQTYSPQPGDSAPQSAYPRIGSPGQAGQQLRPLPSPSSLVYPPSVAASLPAPTVHPGSPAPSYPPSASVHTASTSSATSAHIADLQHQVTLKSLALQTLQSEYSSLLQKLQREKVKSQTIEKKTNVSEQEVNDLTGKNEDLSEQVKSLEMQLYESDRKRDVERAETVKEKEQWGRMLDMGSRLQAKLARERQALADECLSLKRRLAILEAGHSPQAGGSDNGLQNAHNEADTLVRRDSSDLRREVVRLSDKVTMLTRALQEAQRSSRAILADSRNLSHGSDQICAVIDHALKDEKTDTPRISISGAQQNAPSADTTAFGNNNHAGVHQISCPPPLLRSALSPDTAASSNTHNLGIHDGPVIRPAQIQGSPTESKPLRSPSTLPPLIGISGNARSYIHNSLLTPTSAVAPSVAEMAIAGRASTPGAEELGVKVKPTDLTPEELVKALGPIPTMHQSPYRHLPSPYPVRHGQQASSKSSASDHSSPRSVRSSQSPPHALGSGSNVASFRQWTQEPKREQMEVSMPPPPPRRPSSAQLSSYELPTGL
ncbi:hypothetical protein BAUCODRAFT_35707 [Baudoinia panamericana UAMH 10762]|uniref:Uncharacterized protein n=1 Tax=Baudoinia panamericana (strain UAMH 10762) TaxID=717646 RepID=M2MSL3_BAUPA|nr:uncharacterized protein BAUCODRAFT_35707 [Baudoinia panamericana UAMH 10762]EMC94488.1 hypothetical protein BAUCODRAFT_35707 [Baudoinia panamericana UAMH 10762]